MEHPLESNGSASYVIVQLLLYGVVMSGLSFADESLPGAGDVDAFYFRTSGHWVIEFYRDGSARARFGSSPQHSADLPAGSLDFPAVLKSAEWLVANRRSAEHTRPKARITLRRNDWKVPFGVGVSEDADFRDLIESLDNKWRPGPGFRETLKKNPMFLDDARPAP